MSEKRPKTCDQMGKEIATAKMQETVKLDKTSWHDTIKEIDLSKPENRR